MAPTATRTSRRDVLDRLGVPRPKAADDPAVAARLVSWRLLVVVRLGLTPLLLVGGLVADDRHPAFWVLLALRVAADVVAVTRSPRAWALALPAGDLVVLAGLLLTTGGSGSPLLIVAVGLPAALGYLVSPRRSATVGVGVLVAYLAAVLPDVLSGEAGSASRALAGSAAIVFAIVAGVAFALGRRELTQRAMAVAASRRRLLTQSLSAEDAERRRVSQELHGAALQVLLAAAQDLAEDGADGLARARAGIRDAVRLIRETVRDLHPAALRHAGLQASVRNALEHRVRDVVAVEVGPRAEGEREALLLSVVRELGDALAAAGADTAVAARVSIEPGAVVLGLSAGAGPEAAGPLRGSIAGVAERVEADGGSVTVGAGPDGRTMLTVRLAREGDDHAVSEEELDDADDLKRRAQLLATSLLLALTPAIVVVAAFDGDPGTPFYVLVGLVAAYQAAVVGLTLSAAWDQLWVAVGTGVTLAAFAGAVSAQGGVATALPALGITLPFLLVLALRPVGATRACAVLVLALVICAAGPVLDDDPGARAAAVLDAATYAWAVASALLITTGRARMRVRLAALEQARRQLLNDSLAVADAERHRLSMRLHDGALQELMIAGQDLDLALDGDAESLAFARVALTAAIHELRDTMAELHPPALEHGGLQPALTALLDRACARGRLEATSQVGEGAAGVRDELVVALVRELVANVSKHAEARTVAVRLARVDDWLELEVADDGVGMAADRLPAAIAEGHIGLAAARERVESDGGGLRVASEPGAGTRVLVRLRAHAADALPQAPPGLLP